MHVLQSTRNAEESPEETIQIHSGKVFCKSLSDIGWNEEGKMQYDKIALEDHSYTATTEERSRNENSWTHSLHAEGAQGPLNQRGDLRMQNRHAKDCTMSFQQSPEVETNPSLQSNKSDKGAINSLKAMKNYVFRLDASTGWRYYPSSTTPSLSSSSSRWQPSNDLWSTWNWESWDSSSGEQ